MWSRGRGEYTRSHVAKRGWGSTRSSPLPIEPADAAHRMRCVGNARNRNLGRRVGVGVAMGLETRCKSDVAARRPWGRRELPLLLSVLVLHAPVARAALGAAREDLARDAAALRASLSVTPGDGYQVHQMVSADGTTVRAYVEPRGKVFAVTWTGRVQPDLRIVLGEHYSRFLEAARAPHHGHHVLSVATPDLVLSVVQLPRGFSGRAHLPSLVPAGTAVDALP